MCVVSTARIGVARARPLRVTYLLRAGRYADIAARRGCGLLTLAHPCGRRYLEV
jgi:hypothetical protein